jgi:hypothetical protein
MITVFHKFYLFYVKRKFDIVFKGRALTLIEATNKEVKFYLRESSDREKTKSLKILLILNYLDRYLWLAYFIGFLLYVLSPILTK